MLKVCIYGGGAIGGYLAGHLARAQRCDVSVVARGATLEAIRQRGLRVNTPTGSFEVSVRAVSDTAELGVQDYVFLTLKSHQVDAALPSIRRLIGEHTVVLPPTTAIPHYFFPDRPLEGLDPGARQWQAMPPSKVLGCVYWIGAHVSAPGVVEQDGARAGMPIGELDGSRSERVVTLSRLLTESGIDSKVNDNIRSAIWVKFVNSLCWNPVAVLTLARLGEIGAAADALHTVRSMMEEADAVARALGLEPAQAPDKRIAMTLTASGHKMSMLQDLEHGRPLEIDALATSFRAVRELTTVRTPLVDAVLALARLRSHHLPSTSDLA